MVTPPQLPKDAATARLTETDGVTPTQTCQHMINDNMRLAGGRGGAPPGGGGPRRRKADKTARKAHQMPQGSQGARNSRKEVEDPLPRYNTTGLCPLRKGGGPLHGERRVPAGLHP